MPFPSVFAAKEAVHFNRTPERSQASVESSGYFRRRVWEIQPRRFHGRHRGSLCAGLQVPKSSRPPRPAPARCRLRLGLPAGSRGAGGAGSRLSPRRRIPAGRTGTRHRGRRICSAQEPPLPSNLPERAHRLTPRCVWFCGWRGGVLLGTFFFNPQNHVFNEIRFVFFPLSPWPQITSVSLLAVSSFGGKKFFFFSP